MFRSKSLRLALPVFLVVVAILVAGGAAVASNMAFKLNKPLAAPSGANANIGKCWTSLPYFNPYPTTRDLCTQLGLASTATLQAINPQTGVVSPLNQTCLGANTSPIALVSTRGVRVVATSTTPSVIIVGSHNPAQALTLYAPSGSNANIGKNWVSVPYHTTAVTQRDLCVQLGVGVTGTISNINCITGTVNLPVSCTGATAGARNLVLGESVLITTPTQINNALPAHF